MKPPQSNYRILPFNIPILSNILNKTWVYSSVFAPPIIVLVEVNNLEQVEAFHLKNQNMKTEQRFLIWTPKLLALEIVELFTFSVLRPYGYCLFLCSGELVLLFVFKPCRSFYAVLNAKCGLLMSPLKISLNENTEKVVRKPVAYLPY